MQDVYRPCQFCQLCPNAPVDRVSSNTALMQAIVCRICSSGTLPNVLTSSLHGVVSIRGIWNHIEGTCGHREAQVRDILDASK